MGGAAVRLGRGITQHYRTRWPEWCLAWIMLGQATQLLQKSTMSANRVYHVLARMVPEYALASVALGLSITWLVALALNGTFVSFRRVSPWIRAVVAVCAAVYWAVWAITLFQATGRAFASVSYVNHAGLSAMACMCFLMSAREVAVADERAALCRSRTRTG